MRGSNGKFESICSECHGSNVFLGYDSSDGKVTQINVKCVDCKNEHTVTPQFFGWPKAFSYTVTV